MEKKLNNFIFGVGTFNVIVCFNNYGNSGRYQAEAI